MRALLNLHIGALFVLCIKLDVTSTGNRDHMLVLVINKFSSSFFLSGTYQEKEVKTMTT